MFGVGGGVAPFWSLKEQEVCCPGHTQNASYTFVTRVLFQDRSKVSQDPSSPDSGEPGHTGQTTLWWGPGFEVLLGEGRVAPTGNVTGRHG